MAEFEITPKTDLFLKDLQRGQFAVVHSPEDGDVLVYCTYDGKWEWLTGKRPNSFCLGSKADEFRITLVPKGSSITINL